MSAKQENTIHSEKSNRAVETDYETILIIKFIDKDPIQ